ncbi:MAG: type IV secretion system DNA-binding domain-containing protein, partial [Frisingicoccus sp.]|uniref:type IV secretory system conjugative DNA transfer family protein n=1 Tax=Frisingicoccus sp. TaxID=1918627 RepID=UPI002618E70F
MGYEYTNRAVAKCDRQNRNSGVYTRTLFGQSIHENPVPVWTASREQDPFVTLKDPVSGKKIGIRKDMLSYGLVAFADPGGGKTNLLDIIVDRLLVTQGDNDIMVILDTKGDYYREFGRRIPEYARIVIGAGEEYRQITGCHNIFAEIMPRGQDGRLVYTKDSDVDALDISKQLFQKMNSETQPVFPAMAAQILAGVLIYFMRTYWRTDQKKLNNKELIGFLSGSTNAELKAVFGVAYMEDYRNCMDYIADKSHQTQGVNSYIGTILKEMFVGPFADSNSEKEFSMREIVTAPEKKVVFIEYDLKRGEALAPIYGVLIDRALANALGGRQEKRNNVYVILDEMLLLTQKLNHLSNAMNFGRSQGVKILCGLQNFSGAVDIYGEYGAKR